MALLMKTKHKTAPASLLQILMGTLLILSASSCVEEIEIPVDSSPVLGLYGRLSPDSPVMIELFHTIPWVGIEQIEENSVPDADVSLFVNGELRGKLTSAPRPLASPSPRTTRSKYQSTPYWSDYVPAEGDQIRILAVSPKYGRAEASVSIPRSIKLDPAALSYKVTDYRMDLLHFLPDAYTYQWLNGSYLCSADLEITVEFDDPAAESNFYGIGGEIVATSNNPGGIHGSYYDKGEVQYWRSSDVVFKEYLSLIDELIMDGDQIGLFSDNSFNGKRKQLKLLTKIYSYLYWDDDPNHSALQITLVSSSESLFRNVISDRYLNGTISGILGQVGLSDYVWPHSNVTTGAGLLTATSTSTLLLPLDPLFRPLPRPTTPREDALPSASRPPCVALP